MDKYSCQAMKCMYFLLINNNQIKATNLEHELVSGLQ